MADAALPSLPPRPSDGHKGTFGTVCVLGGQGAGPRVMLGGPAFAALGALPAAQRLAGFYTCWTRKEAYVKAIGEGIGAPLERFAVSLGPEEEARFAHFDDEAEAPEEVEALS